MEPLVFVQLHLVEKWYLYQVKKSGLIFNIHNALRWYTFLLYNSFIGLRHLMYQQDPLQESITA